MARSKVCNDKLDNIPTFTKGELVQRECDLSVILCTGGDNTTTFTGTVVHGGASTGNPGFHCATWLKNQFKMFEECILLSN